MTQVEVLYRYGATPSESAMLALANVREIYGVRKLELRELEKTVRVEYDSTRLSEAVIHQLLRRAGLDLVEKMQLYKVPELVAPAPAPAG